MAALLSILLVVGCAGGARSPARVGGPEAAAEQPIRVTILQINDVYEIGPVANGTRGGLARVAEARRRLLEDNPNTLTVLAGDFLSPSAVGTAEVDGERLAGRQMVATLNAMGLDLATIGNHEFDIGEERLRQRLGESQFRWTSSNVTDADGEPFLGVSTHEIVRVEGGAGEVVRIGVIGVLTADHGEDWVTYEDPVTAFRREAAKIADRVDVLIGLTHLSLHEDQLLAESLPEIDLILGGHEHENYLVRRGPSQTPIAKADANAKSVWIHRLTWESESRELEIDSEYLPITDAIPEEPATATVVADWTERAFDGFRDLGFAPQALVALVDEDLDGLESSVRNRTTNLSRLITAAMVREAAGAELAILNSGSIRIDDKIEAGPVTQYDVIRVLPYGGPVYSTEIRGTLLERALDQGLANRGTGGFLQTSDNVTRDATGAWTISGEPIDPARTYRAAMSDYLAQGREVNLGFLDAAAGNPDFRHVDTHRDVRQAVIAELEARYPVD